MSFSAEINDFVNGFKAGAAVGGDIQDRKLVREKFEYDKAFKERGYADSNARANRSLDLRERGLNMRAATNKATAEERAAAKAEKDRARRANQLIEGGGGSRGRQEPEDEYYPDDAFDSGDGDTYETEEDVSYAVPEVTGDSVQVAAAGGPIVLEDEGEYESLRMNVEDKGDPETALPEAPREPNRTDVIPRAIEQEAIPAQPSAEPEAPEVDPAVNREGKGDPVFKKAAQITRDVMDEWNGELQKPEAAIETENPKKIQDRVSDTKPASPAEIKAIDAKIDPEGKMEPYRKGAARLVDAYNFFIEKGDVTKARKIAAQILKFNQMASMTLGQLAQTAIEQGDISSASKLVTDAYNENIPDGGKLTAKPTANGTVIYQIDREGFTQQKGEIGAKQLWELAGGIANGSEFIKRMQAVAGEAGATSDGKSGKKRRSYRSDVTAAAEAMKQYDDLLSAYNETEDPEAKRELYARLKESRAAADKAKSIAAHGAEKTGRSSKQFDADLSAAIRNSMNALPPEPDAPTEAAIPEEGSSWLNPSAFSPDVNRWINSTIPGGGDWFGIQARKKAQQAAPAAPAGPPPVDQRQVDKVYETPRGPARWTGQGWELLSNGAQ